MFFSLGGVGPRNLRVFPSDSMYSMVVLVIVALHIGKIRFAIVEGVTVFMMANETGRGFCDESVH